MTQSRENREEKENRPEAEEILLPDRRRQENGEEAGEGTIPSTPPTYEAFKQALDVEIRGIAGGFIRAGYLLKLARDTDILSASGYATVAEFAQAEYGFTKDIVSRYIAINDRYSEGGYSDRMQEKYRDYGVAKLAEMLTLPDAMIEAMSPRLTRREIQEIKREVREEQGITDLEVMMEGRSEAHAGLSLFQSAIYEYLRQDRARFLRLIDRWREQTADGMPGPAEEARILVETVPPSDVAVITARVQGVGKLAVAFKGEKEPIDVVNLRSSERQTLDWQQAAEQIRQLYRLDNLEGPAVTGEERYWEIYGTAAETAAAFEVPEREAAGAPGTGEGGMETAAVSEIPERKTAGARGTREGDIEAAAVSEVLERKATGEEKKADAARERVAGVSEIMEAGAETAAESIPGQMEVEDYPELLPGPERASRAKEVAPVQPTLSCQEAGKRRAELLGTLKESLDTLYRAAEKGIWEQVWRFQDEISRELSELQKLGKVLEDE